jgi:hypothetical protein
MKRFRAKRKGLGLDFRTFMGQSGKIYLVFQTTQGSFHVLTEVEAKQAARDCGSTIDDTRAAWNELWEE